MKDYLKSGSEFWDSTKTLKHLSESEYFIDTSKSEQEFSWPSVIKGMMAESKCAPVNIG